MSEKVKLPNNSTISVVFEGDILVQLNGIYFINEVELIIQQLQNAVDNAKEIKNLT